MSRRPKVDVDLRPFYQGEERGHHSKDLIVLHETVSHNKPGLSDITAPAAFLDATGLEIHGIVDMEGHSAWCYDPTAVYDHAASGQGAVNTRGIGFELVSEVPFLPTNKERREAWSPTGPRRKQLDRIAAWIAWLAPKQGIPIRPTMSKTPGITTHWQVSKTWLDGDGHWDCFPVHLGGHFPLLYVVNKALQISEGR